MQILFTKSDTLLSKLIRKITREDVSHCALYQDGIVIHYNLLGLQLELYSSFVSRAQVVHTVDLPGQTVSLDTIVANKQAGYDYGALLYVGLRYLFPFLPKKNLWQCSGMYLCTEWVSHIIDREEDSMITPYGLYLKLKEKEI